MALEDLSSEVPIGTTGLIRRVTLSATPGQVRAITLPRWCRVNTITLKQSDETTADTGAVALSGTDEAVQVDDAWPIDGPGYIMRMAPGQARPLAAPTIYISAATASGFAYLHLELGS